MRIFGIQKQWGAPLQHKHKKIYILIIFLLTILSLQACGADTKNITNRVATNADRQTQSENRGSQQGNQSSSEIKDNNIVTPAMLKNAQKALSDLNNEIKQLKAKGVDVHTQQQKYQAGQQSVKAIATTQDYILALISIGADRVAVESDAAQGNGYTLVQTLQDKAQSWGNAHKWHNPYDKQNYLLDTSYLNLELGYGAVPYLTNRLSTVGPSAYQEVEDVLFHLAMLEANAEDMTPYNKTHATDTQILSYYHLQEQRVMVVSLTEQAMRVYENGKLVRSFLVTTGRANRPTPPGLWSLSTHLTNVPFTSFDPPGSPDYYKPVTINYAVEFRAQGYYVHDSWWRKDYGPGTQFPHEDSSHDSDAGTGSHGCVNLPTNQMLWVYQNSSANTKLVVY
ncbi:L,D-transpeptidase [Ktedonospora formicarum]|uniref:L,D-TPase catalytic domain-containing protein n=1 Tax=Ktedonospora formicarum TaxID=2778364 RepID=A0A8J3MSZ9_9CHLR|nr:L,D-transpeptidase [Ktedonospora formicarum]GHO46645.1 hypothetical protein KSX_48080 [Ktedonospora formicarum]